MGATSGRVREALTRHRWYAVLPVGAGAAALATGAFMLAGGHPSRPLAEDCGIIRCSATVPGATPTGSGPQGSPRGRLSAPPTRARHRPSPTASPPATPTVGATTPAAGRPSARPSPTPSPSATPGAVTVSYSLDLRWRDGFQGHFTIVNNTSAPLSGWTLTAALPGDQVQSVWSASYTVSGNTLTLTPASYQPTIAPGASQAAYFTASGTTRRPTSCVFNNQTCG
jgi:cellulase/cellobiase CelA1